VIPKDRDIYDREFALAVVRRIDGLEAGRIDPAYLNTEDWQSDVEQIIEVVGSRKQRDKRRYFVAALANSAAHDRPALVERKRFLDELERLRLSHLRLLSVLVLPPENLGDGTSEGYLRARLPGQETEHIKLDWTDLQAAGMLGSLPGGITSTPKPVMVAGALLPLGRRFTDFIAAGEPDDDETAETSIDPSWSHS
jgi:hypothetical protein